MLPADRTAAAGGPSDFYALLVEPDAELRPVEANEASYLEVGDPSLRHEPLNMSRCHAQCLGDTVNVDEG
jgi:hypothetical protein